MNHSSASFIKSKINHGTIQPVLTQ